MKQGLLTWNPCRHFLSLPTTSLSLPSKTKTHLTVSPRHLNPISATTESVNEQLLSAKERRQLRNEKRENKSNLNWREEVEERLMNKPKKRYVSWTEELNLDNLALLGPQWWVVKVPTVSVQNTAESIARSLSRKFPDMDFKIYTAAVQVKMKLKNGSFSVKHKPLFRGSMFLRCVLNREIHDFLRECDGVRGFIGAKVGNIIRQINKPKPVSAEDMELIFQQTRDEQEKVDQAFEEEQQREKTIHPENLNVVYVDSPVTSKDVSVSIVDSKPKRRSRKKSQPAADKRLRPGSTIRVVSGTFTEFSGILKKMDLKAGRATVGFALFGKEIVVDLAANEIVLETK